MVSLPPNQEASRVFSLDDKLDPNFDKPAIKPEKPEDLKISKFQLFRKKLADASSLIKNKVKSIKNPKFSLYFLFLI
jgi:hypothetical protein